MPTILPVSELQRNMREIAAECHRTKEPIYLTKNGYKSLVLIDADAYDDAFDERALDYAEQLRLKETLDLSYLEAAAGETISLEEAVVKANAYRIEHGLEAYE